MEPGLHEQTLLRLLSGNEDLVSDTERNLLLNEVRTMDRIARRLSGPTELSSRLTQLKLVLHLQRITAVDENDGRLVEDESGAGRSSKARRPSEALVTGRQVFILVFIVVGDVDAVELHRLHRCAQHRKICAPDGWPADDFVCLPHDGSNPRLLGGLKKTPGAPHRQDQRLSRLKFIVGGEHRSALTSR